MKSLLSRFRIFLLTAAFVFPLFLCRADDDTKTLAYHLATNAVGRAKGFSGNSDDMYEISPPTPSSTNLNMARFKGITWHTNFWLFGAKGLSATPVGFTNLFGGQGLPTMVSPRHYLVSAHMHPEGYLMAFLDTNNVIYWRNTLARLDTGSNDISIGILTEDLPPSVGFLPVLPTNYLDYFPTNASTYFQGIGMNQDFRLFSEPMQFYAYGLIHWDHHFSAPNGLGTNWNVQLVAGDSSNPAMILVRNQLVLVSHNWGVGAGPNYALQIKSINQGMHYLSTNHHVGSDYQLTSLPLNDWPKVNPPAVLSR